MRLVKQLGNKRCAWDPALAPKRTPTLSSVLNVVAVCCGASTLLIADPTSTMADNTTVHADYAAASALAKYPFEPVSPAIRGQQ